MATKDENTYWGAVKDRVGELASKVMPKKDMTAKADKLVGTGRTRKIDDAVDAAVNGSEVKESRYKKGGLVRRGYGYGKARGA